MPYRAGTGLSEIDPSSTPEVTSLEATAGVAAGPLTPGRPDRPCDDQPGVEHDGRPGRPGRRPVRQSRHHSDAEPRPGRPHGDFTGNGLDDLAVLTASGVSIYLANGQGGFLPPTTYAVPSESDGLTVADVTGNGKLDLLVGDAYGDVLVLLGNGNGTFEPYHEANQAVELAVADLTGNGSKDIIYADQGLDRVVVDYGAGNSTVLANQSTGLLDPGAVAAGRLEWRRHPRFDRRQQRQQQRTDLPRAGQRPVRAGDQRRQWLLRRHQSRWDHRGQPHGRRLPDLVVADKGSNQVSILLNQSQQGGAISFSAGPRLNSGGSGPVSTVVGNFTGGAFPDLLVTNSQSNDVALLPGVGQGFFNDTEPANLLRGHRSRLDLRRQFQRPDRPGDSQRRFERFDADLRLQGTGCGDQHDRFRRCRSGCRLRVRRPAAALTTWWSATPAMASWRCSREGPDGLGLAAAATEPNLPDPTALAFSALTGGQVQFYAATAGHESAELVALSLGIETATLFADRRRRRQNAVAQLVPLHESSLPLLATVLTLTITVSGDEFNLGLQETEATAVAAFLSGTGVSVGQSLSSQAKGGPGGDDNAESDERGDECCRPGPHGDRTMGTVRTRSRPGHRAIPAGKPQRRFGCAGRGLGAPIVPIRRR